MELREIDGTSLCCQFFVVNQRICPAFILSAAQRGRSGGSSSSREARHGGDFIPLLEGPSFGCLQPLHLREREKHLRCPLGPSALRLCRPRVRLLALLPFRLPCFWSAWLDMLQNPIRPSVHHELHSRHLLSEPLLDFPREPHERSWRLFTHTRF